jgi:DNA adenine methylase
MSTITQPIKWHGGKHYLAPKLVALMPEHTRYLEAFAGGLSVLLAKPYEGIAEWVNDTNLMLTNFWRVLADEADFNRFARFVEATPLSEVEFRNAGGIDHGNPIFAAVDFFVRIRQSRQGLGRDYCTPTRRTRRGMNEQVSAWLTAVDGLPEAHARLRRVEVWRRPAVEAIQKLDGGDLLVYADPPYMHDTRSSVGEYGNEEMGTRDHKELLETLAAMQGKFLLSGYHNAFYDDFASDHGWRSVDFDLPNNASGKKEKERKTECVWMNY